MKKVVYNCPYVPSEWMAAHGLAPTRLIPMAAQGGDVIRVAEGICPYAAAFANEAAAIDAPVVFTTRCDQMRRAYELFAMRTARDAFLLNIPHTWQDPVVQSFYIQELSRLSRFLVDAGGKAPDRQRLLDAMFDDAAERADHRVYIGKGVPVAVVGGPLMQQDAGLFEIIAAHGGQVVLDATETGPRCRHRPFDRRAASSDPLMELAFAYLDIPDVFLRPNSGLYVWLRDQLDLNRPKGVIFHHYIWCDRWRAEYHRFKEWAGLPVLLLDDDGRSGLGTGRAANRIASFMENIR